MEETTKHDVLFIIITKALWNQLKLNFYNCLSMDDFISDYYF